MLITLLLGACGSLNSGSAEFTITDLVDPTGRLEENWSAEAARWNWAETDPLLEVWLLSLETQTFNFDSDHYYLNSLVVSTRQFDCFQELMDVHGELLEAVEEGDSLEQHCAAFTTFMNEIWGDWEPEEGIVLSAEFYESVDSLPADRANWQGSWEGSASLVWNDGLGKSPLEGWDPEGCVLEVDSEDDWVDTEVSQWGLSDEVVTLESGDDPVVGSFSAELTGDETSGTLDVEFEAALCEYTRGPVLFLVE